MYSTCPKYASSTLAHRFYIRPMFPYRLHNLWQPPLYHGLQTHVQQGESAKTFCLLMLHPQSSTIFTAYFYNYLAQTFLKPHMQSQLSVAFNYNSHPRSLCFQPTRAIRSTQSIFSSPVQGALYNSTNQTRSLHKFKDPQLSHTRHLTDFPT